MSVLSTLPVTVLVGTALGFLSGIGVGGGSLLVLWLTLVLGLDPQAARSINLLFFIPCALIACIYRIREKVLDVRPLLPAILSGCAATVICTIISASMDKTLLRKGFGILLLIAGTRELFYRPRKAK